MTSPISPFSIDLTLLKEEKRILLAPFQTDPLIPFHIRSHLTNLSQQIRAASSNRYHIISTAPSAASTSTNNDLSFTATNLKQLVERLHSWIINNSSIITSSCGTVFYQEMHQSLVKSASLLQDPYHPITEKEKPLSSKKSTNKKGKKRSHPTTKNSSSIPRKKKQKTINLEAPVTSATISSQIESSLSSSSSQLVKEIIFLNSNTFTIQPVILSDFESWICLTHQMIENILNYADIFFVQSADDVAKLKDQSCADQKNETYKTLLEFMLEQESFLIKMPENFNKQAAKLTHSSLIKQLRQGTSEIERSSTPITEASVTIMKKTHKKSTPHVVYQISNTAKNEITIKKDIRISLTPNIFRFSFRNPIYQTYIFKNFLKKVNKASLYSYYTCSQTIKEIEPTPQNQAIIFKSLYYAVTNNYSLFKQRQQITTNLHKQINTTLNSLNSLYCSKVQSTSKPSRHHNDLIQSTITEKGFITSSISNYCLSYTSVEYRNLSKKTATIQKISITASSTQLKALLNNFLNSLFKHQARMHLLFNSSKTRDIILKCIDDAWPLTSSDRPLSHKELCNILLKISEENVKRCLSYFYDISPTGEVTTYYGYEKVYSITSSLSRLFNQDDSATSTSLLKVSKIPSYLEKNYFPFLALIKNNATYHELKFLPLSRKKNFNLTYHMLNQTKKQIPNIKTLLAEEPFLPIQHENILIKDPAHVLALLFLGFTSNIIFLKYYYENTCNRHPDSKTYKYYQETIQILETTSKLLETKWKKLKMEGDISNIKRLSHPLKDEITLIMNSLKLQNLTNPKKNNTSNPLALEGSN